MPDIAQDALPDGTPSLTDRLTGILGGISKNTLLSVLKNLFDTAIINSQAGSYTLLASDNGKHIEITSATPAVITVPTGLPAGFNCAVWQLGAGAVSFLAGTGVTVRGNLSMPGQNTSVFLLQRATNDFALNTGSGASLPTLAAPTLNLSVISSSEIDLTWNNVTGATTYVLDYSVDNVTFTNLYAGGALSFNKTGLAPSTHYYFRVKAQGSGYNDSAYGTNNGTTLAGSGTTLNAPVLTAGTPTSSTIPLTWTDPNTSPQEVNFELQYSTDNITWNALSTPAQNLTSYTDTGLGAGVLRYYRIRAVGNGGTILTSSWSNTVSASTTGGVSNLTLAANYGYTNSSQVFTVTGGGTAWGNSGVDDKYLPSGVDCRVYMKYVDTTTVDGFFGIHDINMGAQYPEIRACFRFTGGILETREAGTATNRGSVTAGTWYGLFRNGTTGVVKIQSSTDETTWTDIATLTYTNNGALYIVSDLNGAGKISTPKATGVTAIPTISGATAIDIVFATSSGLTNTSQVFTPSTNDANYGHDGVDAKTLASTTDGRIWQKYTGGKESVLGFATNSTNNGYPGMLVGFYQNLSDNYVYKVEAGTASNIHAQLGLNYYYGIFRTGSSGAFKLIRSSDGLNWMDCNVAFTGTSTALLNIKCDLKGATTSKLDHPQGNGIA